MLGCVPEAEWRKLQSALGDANTIRERASIIAQGLAEVFQPSSVPTDIGLSFSTARSELALIGTPFYPGRLRLDWSVEDDLVGKLVAERHILNEHDQLVWQPVFSLTVPHRGSIDFGSDDQRFTLYMDIGMLHLNRNALFALGMSVLHAFAKAPLLR